MRTTKYILGIMMSTALLFTGCMKEDIDELRKQQEENAARITSLEEWQTSVNNQITSLQGLIDALEANDYVTGVTPVKQGGVEIGYTITFTKSPAITIYHGTDGTDGTNGTNGTNGTDGRSPLIGVAKDTDGKYYWTLDGEWLTDDGTPTGNKIPVTGNDGADGTTPTVEIGSNGNWWINGTDTGVKAAGTDGTTPTVAIGSNGNWWINGTDTGVKAAGTDGVDGTTPTVAIGSNGNWWIILYEG